MDYKKGPVIIIGSAEGKGLSADVRAQLADILPQYKTREDCIAKAVSETVPTDNI